MSVSCNLFFIISIILIISRYWVSILFLIKSIILVCSSNLLFILFLYSLNSILLDNVGIISCIFLISLEIVFFTFTSIISLNSSNFFIISVVLDLELIRSIISFIFVSTSSFISVSSNLYFIILTVFTISS